MAFFAEAGLTAKISPSITNARPSATTKSDMTRRPWKAPRMIPRRKSLLTRRSRCRRRRSVVTHLAGGVREIAEEVRIRAQHHAGVTVSESRLVGLHRAVEGKEVRVLFERLGEDAIAF